MLELKTKEIEKTNSKDAYDILDIKDKLNVKFATLYAAIQGAHSCLEERKEERSTLVSFGLAESFREFEDVLNLYKKINDDAPITDIES